VKKLNNYRQYQHNVQVPLFNFDLDVWDIINGDYFAALMDSNDRVYIFGFEFGLQPKDFLFESHSVNIVTLSSNELEDVQPLIFSSNDPVHDFYNNFSEEEIIIGNKYLLLED